MKRKKLIYLKTICWEFIILFTKLSLHFDNGITMYGTIDTVF